MALSCSREQTAGRRSGFCSSLTEHVSLPERDVLLPPPSLPPTFSLFLSLFELFSPLLSGSHLPLPWLLMGTGVGGGGVLQNISRLRHYWGQSLQDLFQTPSTFSSASRLLPDQAGGGRRLFAALIQKAQNFLVAVVHSSSWFSHGAGEIPSNTNQESCTKRGQPLHHMCQPNDTTS